MLNRNEYTPMRAPNRLPVVLPATVMLATDRALWPSARVNNIKRNNPAIPPLNALIFQTVNPSNTTSAVETARSPKRSIK